MNNSRRKLILAISSPCYKSFYFILLRKPTHKKKTE